MDNIMPVIRISQETWATLKAQATPLEDTANDVVNLALDALELAQRKGLQVRRQAVTLPRAQTDRSKRRNPLSLKQFRLPLLQTLHALGGSAYSREIRTAMEPMVTPMLGATAYETLTNGQPRWWNAVCSVRNDLIREGLFRNDSERGIWDLSERGIEFVKERAKDGAEGRGAGPRGFRRKKVRARRKLFRL